jgi:hypothetical protein
MEDHMADRLISCDDHMDLSQLPADLWTTRLPASLLDRAPHIEERRQHQRPPRPRAPSPRPRFQAITPPAPHPAAPLEPQAQPQAAVQRCCVHKLRNLERRAPKHALAEIRDDFHRIVYAGSAEAARAANAAFERKWAKRCPGVVASLREGGDELLTFYTFPKAQWKTLRTTNAIERLHEEFRRRVKTQGSLPGEEAAVVLLFSLVASGQIRLRRIDGWRKIAAVLSQHTAVAA